MSLWCISPMFCYCLLLCDAFSFFFFSCFYAFCIFYTRTHKHKDLRAIFHQYEKDYVFPYAPFFGAKAVTLFRYISAHKWENNLNWLQGILERKWIKNASEFWHEKSNYLSTKILKNIWTFNNFFLTLSKTSAAALEFNALYDHPFFATP